MADERGGYGEDLDWDVPACHELAIGGSRGGNLRNVYVGETVNERKRLIAYASHCAHLAKIINWHLRQGWHIFYRAQTKNSKRDALKMQDRLLAEFEYD
ncbi:MAG TPA: hypothetical protein VGB26_14260 [Nitrospiria bacterium]|jgi:hypothetical protein